jgi:hypothetical protein
MMRNFDQLKHCRFRVYVAQANYFERWWCHTEGAEQLDRIIRSMAHISFTAEADNDLWYFEIHDPDGPPMARYARYGTDPSAMDDPTELVLMGKHIYIDPPEAAQYFARMAAAESN